MPYVSPSFVHLTLFVLPLLPSLQTVLGTLPLRSNTWELLRRRDTKPAAVHATMQAESQTQCVGTVQVRSVVAGKGFNIMLDGQLFGPCQKIRISRCPARSMPSGTMNFNVQCFHPWL